MCINFVICIKNMLEANPHSDVKKTCEESTY